MKIILISCAAKKLNHPAKAKEIYDSPLFKKSLLYAQKIKPEKIFILSAKYGLLDPEKTIEPYNKTLNKTNKSERKEWSIKVLKELEKKANLNKDEFIFLAGKNYREFIVPKIKNYQVPLKGLGIGKQLKWLKTNL